MRDYSKTNKTQRDKNKKKYGTTHPRLNKMYICKACGKEFQPFSTLAKYCSRTCAGKAAPKKQKKICPICKKKFTTHSGTSQSKYCSTGCYYKAIAKKPKKCPVCGVVFQKKNRKYCSRKCGYIGIKGKPKKTNLKRYKLDDLWALVVKARAGNKCEYCGETKRLNSHHIFSRSNHSVRWLVENGVCLCVSHHIFGTMSAHKAPIEFAEWLKDIRGEEWYDNLRMEARKIAPKLTKDRKQQIYKELKEQLK